MVRFLWFLLATHGLILGTNRVKGQFVKQGCYDLAPLVCPDEQAAILPWTPQPDSVDNSDEDAPVEFEDDDDVFWLNYKDIERVCRRLEEDVIPREIILDTTRHADYLNSIDATDPFCAEIQFAYGQCYFCSTQRDRDECTTRAQVVQCGGQPTREEIIMDNSNYPLYQTDNDISAGCNALELFGNQKMRSMDMCEREKQIKHLCPGNCEGGCFTAKEHPPTCDSQLATTTNGTVVDSMTTRQGQGGGNNGRPPGNNRPPPPGNSQGRGPVRPACDKIIEKAFYGVVADIFLDTSNHLEYLKSISANDSFCEDARAEYKDCIWCNRDNLCFSEENPPSCDPPEGSDGNAEDLESLLEVEEVCHAISGTFFDLHDIFDTSMHATRMAIQKDSPLCELAQSFYHKCFWCAKDVPGAFCAKDAACNNMIDPDEVIPERFQSLALALLGGVDGPENKDKCEPFVRDVRRAGLKSPVMSLQACYEELILVKHCQDQYCPQAEGPAARDDSYLGATTESEKRALIWVARASAILSFVGGSFVLFDSLSNAKARETVYHQLLIGMAIFDLITAVSWCFATIPIDASFNGADHVLGVMGNQASCRAQGFFIQLGFTSVFYNVSLSLYYVLVIAYDWKEFQLKKIRVLMHAIPCMLGLGLALGAIGSYDFMGYACHLLPHPEGSLGTVMLFVIAPLGLSIVAITSSMFVVYAKVRQRAGASRKWSLGVGTASKLEQAVFWQCVFYVLAFYITWPIMFAVYLGSVGVNGPLGLALTIAFVAPLSGFTNFLVYIRPKLISKFRSRKSHAQRSHPGEAERTSSSSSAPSSFFMTAARRIFRRNRMSASSNGQEAHELRARQMDPSVLVAMDPSVSMNTSRQSLAVPALTEPQNP